MLEVGPLIFTVAVAGKIATLRPVEKAVEVKSRTQTVAARVTQRDFMKHLLRCTNICAAGGRALSGARFRCAAWERGLGATHTSYTEKRSILDAAFSLALTWLSTWGRVVLNPARSADGLRTISRNVYIKGRQIIYLEHRI